MKYSELFAMSYAGVGVANYYQFRINSIHDPNLTGIGHQPLAHDQFEYLYNRYRVYGMKYRITFTNQETTKHVEVMVQMRPNNTVDTNAESIREAPYTVYKSCLGVEGSGQAVKVAKGYASVPKIRGISRARMVAEDSLQSTFGANPVMNPTLNLYISNQNTAEAAVVNVRVDLVYYVECFDRKLLSQS